MDKGRIVSFLLSLPPFPPCLHTDEERTCGFIPSPISATRPPSIFSLNTPPSLPPSFPTCVDNDTTQASTPCIFPTSRSILPEQAAHDMPWMESV